MRIDRSIVTAAAALGLAVLAAPVSASTAVPAADEASVRTQPAYARVATNANQTSRRVPQHGQRSGGPRGRR